MVQRAVREGQEALGSGIPPCRIAASLRYVTEPHLRRLRRASGAVVDRSVRRVETRFVVLTALRWLPVGFIAPVVVLFASSRGLSAVEIGLMFSVQAVVVILLELPTGGLADTIGRRPGFDDADRSSLSGARSVEPR